MTVAAALLTGCFGSSGTGGSSGPDDNPSDAIPDQDSFSLSAEELTVKGAFDSDGKTTMVNVRLADNLNTSDIPDGTQVNFIAEGGKIEPTCETQDGACSVQWVSQRPRPADARVSILTWTLGTESFNDLNSNGVFDDAVPDVQTDDVPEPFLDANENGTRDPSEVFIEFPTGVTSENDDDATFDTADGLYSGPDCAFPGQCATNERVFIFDNIVLVMGDDQGGSLTFTDCAGGPAPNPLTPSNGPHCLRATDANGNPFPPGASIQYQPSGAVSVSGPETYPNTNARPTPQIEFDISASGMSDTGTLTVTVSASGGPQVSGSIGTSD